MNTEVEKFADYLIEWIVSKCDLEFDRQTEFNIVRMIVDCVELYEKESKIEWTKYLRRLLRNRKNFFKT